jgi:glycerol-3-phosphate dehydrogenase (NAD(P)+)
MKISIIGAGGWGTTLANLLSEKNNVSLWVREPELLEIIKKEKENKWFLQGVKLSDKINFSNNVDIVKDAEIVIFAVPTKFMRSTAKLFPIDKDAIIITVAKGLEPETHKRMSEVLEEELGNKKIIALAGPNHAEEISRKIPAGTVIASKDLQILDKVKDALSTEYFKVYPHDDIIGVEICSAMKNIIAIASGVISGLKLGDNAEGIIITYGLTEMNEFGKFFGAKRKTTYGLAGVGDLIATCTSKHSRNRFVGKRIAEGKSFEEIKGEMHGMVAEGISTAKAIHELSVKNNIKMPLTEQVYKVLYEKKDLKKAIKDLIDLI